MNTAHSSRLIAESEKIKVYYPGPGIKTYHPQLGKLVRNEEFDLADAIAAPYLKSGLLKKVEKAHSSQLIAESDEGEA